MIPGGLLLWYMLYMLQCTEMAVECSNHVKIKPAWVNKTKASWDSHTDDYFISKRIPLVQTVVLKGRLQP